MSKSLSDRYNSWYQGVRFRLSENNSPLFIGFYKYLYRPSRGSLNDFLDRYSRSKKPFTVIQIGANDGLLHDPIHKFVKRDRWQGIILEPQSHIFKTYLERVYRKNPGIHTLCAAIGEEDGYRKLYKIGFTQMRWASGLASFDREQIMKAFSSGRVKEFCDRYGIEIPASPNEQIVSEVVRVVRPETLLVRYHISEIDLLIVDTEGSGRVPTIHGAEIRERNDRIEYLYDPAKIGTNEIIASISSSRRIVDLFSEWEPIERIVARMYQEQKT